MPSSTTSDNPEVEVISFGHKKFSSSVPITYAFSGTPTITSEKLNGKNFLAWSASVELWFLGQGLSDHLTTSTSDVPQENRS